MQKKITILGILIALALTIAACGGQPSAQNASMPPAKVGTALRKIQERARLIVGVKYDVPTFGYMNAQTNTLEGFDPAVAREIAAYIFGDPTKVEFKEAISANRMPFLKDGTVDLILSTMTINEDRLKEIDFSFVYYVAGQRLLVPKDSAIKTTADLDANKKVGSAKGSTSVANLRKLTKAQVVEFDTYSQATQAMLSKQLDAVSTDDTNLYGLALANPFTKVVGAQFSYEPYGIGVAKGNAELLDAVNTVVKNLKASGKWKAIWQKEIGEKLGMTAAPEPPGDEWRKP